MSRAQRFTATLCAVAFLIGLLTDYVWIGEL